MDVRDDIEFLTDDGSVLTSDEDDVVDFSPASSTPLGGLGGALAVGCRIGRTHRGAGRAEAARGTPADPASAAVSDVAEPPPAASAGLGQPLSLGTAEVYDALVAGRAFYVLQNGEVSLIIAAGRGGAHVRAGQAGRPADGGRREFVRAVDPRCQAAPALGRRRERSWRCDHRTRRRIFGCGGIRARERRSLERPRSTLTSTSRRRPGSWTSCRPREAVAHCGTARSERRDRCRSAPRAGAVRRLLPGLARARAASGRNGGRGPGRDLVRQDVDGSNL